MRTYRLYESRSGQWRMERWDGDGCRPFQVDRLPVESFFELRSGGLETFYALMDEDERLGRVEWSEHFVNLRMRCAEVL